MKKNTLKILGLLVVLLGVGWFLTQQPKEPAGGIPPGPDTPGIYWPGETFTQILTYTPTQTIVADEDVTDGRVTLLRKAIAVYKYGESTPRKYREESITPQLTAGVTQNMIIDYTIPAIEGEGAFFVLFIVSKVDGTLVDVVTEKWSWTSTQLGTDGIAIFVKEVIWDPAEIQQKIQSMLLLLINQICTLHPTWCF